MKIIFPEHLLKRGGGGGGAASLKTENGLFQNRKPKMDISVKPKMACFKFGYLTNSVQSQFM